MTKTDENNQLIDDLEIGSDEDKKQNDKQLVLSPAKASILLNLLETVKDSVDKISTLLGQDFDAGELQRISMGQPDNLDEDDEEVEGGRIIEGVFDGENMIGPDGKQYSTPANYASKSKLVEGDILKLTITSNGTFVYKQIGPIERRRVVGLVEQTPSGNFNVLSEGKKWRVLTASVTYFRGQAGDEAVILVPKVGDSQWAAVENIVRQPK